MNRGKSTPYIYINGRFLEQPLSGVQRYASEMVHALDRLLMSENGSRELWCLLTTGRERQSPRLKFIEVRPVESVFKGHAWEQLALSRAARDGVLLGMGGSGPLAHSRQLVIIHDASVFRHPQFFSAAYGLWHRTIGRLLAKRARVGTVSQFSRRELAEVLGLDAEGVPVFYNGSDHMSRTDSSPEGVNRWGLRGRPYFVLLGNLTRNKNVAVAIEALADVPEAMLVLVGGMDTRVFARNSHVAARDRLVLTGRLSDESIVGLLRSATGLIFPSLYEGFGIPPLEAMVQECPVIASDIAPVREICGDAVRYFNPVDPRGLAECMRDCLAEGAAERSERVRRAAARAKGYTWDESARRLLRFCRDELLAETASR